MLTWKRIAPAILAALCVLVVACGDSGSDSSATTDSAPGQESTSTDGLSKAQFIDRADEICRKTFEEMTKVTAGSTALAAENDYAGLADLFDRVASIGDDLTADLRDLDYQGEGADSVDSFLATTDETMDVTRKLAETMRSGGLAEINGISTEVNRLSTKARGIAAGFGLKECRFNPQQ